LAGSEEILRRVLKGNFEIERTEISNPKSRNIGSDSECYESSFIFRDFGFEISVRSISKFPIYCGLGAYGPTSGLACVFANDPSSAATPRATAAVSLPAWKQVKSGRS